MSESIFISSARFTKTIGVLKPFPISLTDRFDVGIWRPWQKFTLFQDLAMQVPVTAADQPVRVIADVSGNNYHWVAPSDARRGIYRETGGVFAGIDMSGDKGYSLSGDALGLLSGVSQALASFAINLDGISTYRRAFRINTNSNDARLEIATGDSAASIYAESRRAAGEAAARVPIARPAGAHVYSALANYVAGVVSVHIDHNRASQEASGMVAGVSSAGAANGAYLGNFNEANFSNMRFHGGMVLAGAGIDEAVRLSVEQYLAENTGIALVG